MGDVATTTWTTWRMADIGAPATHFPRFLMNLEAWHLGEMIAAAYRPLGAKVP